MSKARLLHAGPGSSAVAADRLEEVAAEASEHNNNNDNNGGVVYDGVALEQLRAREMASVDARRAAPGGVGKARPFESQPWRKALVQPSSHVEHLHVVPLHKILDQLESPKQVLFIAIFLLLPRALCTDSACHACACQQLYPCVGVTASSVPALHCSFTRLMSTRSPSAQIDYLSLDVEGAEWLVMQHFDWHRYTFLCLTVERPSCELTQVLHKICISPCEGTSVPGTVLPCFALQDVFARCLRPLATFNSHS